MTKQIVFVDMDGVLADFDGAISKAMVDPPEMFVPGFYKNLKVMPGAYRGIAELLSLEHISLYVGSKPTTGNLFSTIEKYEWIAVNFPRLLKRIVLVCDKSLLRGDFLIDDDKDRWAHKFKGEFIHFDRLNSANSWKNIVCKFKGE